MLTEAPSITGVKDTLAKDIRKILAEQAEEECEERSQTSGRVHFLFFFQKNLTWSCQPLKRYNEIQKKYYLNFSIKN
jgi:hypothetical protein